MISALVLAAGQSKRMGSPKMILPWGDSTVIGNVIATLVEAGLSSIYVITGGDSAAVEQALGGYELNFVFNPDFTNGEMLSSVQYGLKNLGADTDAALIVLGDQPQIDREVVLTILKSYLPGNKHIIVPSYRMHRGHPMLIERSFWQEIIALQPPATLRDYLIQNQSNISYVNVSSPSILQDLDTPDDYVQQKP